MIKNVKKDYKNYCLKMDKIVQQTKYNKKQILKKVWQHGWDCRCELTPNQAVNKLADELKVDLTLPLKRWWMF